MSETPCTISIIAYLLALNTVAGTAFAVDKSRARRNGRRIPEKHLLGLAGAGGSLGALAAMYICRHKNRKPQFAWGLPAILMIQVSLALFILSRCGG